MRVTRRGLGIYTVYFTNLGAQMHSAGTAGHVQLRAVGTGKSHCEVVEWGDAGTPDFKLELECYSADGKPADSKFVVLVALPTPRLAYTYANEPTSASYPPVPGSTWNPTGGPVTITRLNVGEYNVMWSGIDPEIVDGGNVQVSAAQQGDVQCKAASIFQTGLIVRCFARNGQRVDWAFAAMLGS
jgi:hypothetical protein